MAMTMEWPVRVVVSEGDIRRIILKEKPKDLTCLLSELQEKLALTYTFNLQFEDPLFQNALCNLTDISELQDRPTLKILPHACPSPSNSLASTSTDDTIILTPETRERLNDARKVPWPAVFEIPEFSVDVNYRLSQGDLKNMLNDSRLNITKDMKHDILQKLAETIYKYTAYPQEQHFEQVAAALVERHPCLKEAGSPNGYSGWMDSLKYKMGNFRSKMRAAGMADVVVNSNKCMKRRTDDDTSSPRIKKPKRSETNFLPNFPLGEDKTSLEKDRKELEMDVKRKPTDSSDINKKMEKTFALRRREIVEDQPPVKVMLERWPGLFTETQVFAEFQRVASRDLRRDFYDSLDKFSPRLLDIMRKKNGATGLEINRLLQQTNAQALSINSQRTAVLQCLPAYLGDDYKSFMLRCTDSEDRDFSEVPVAILSVLTEDSPPELNSLAIILEGNIVLDDMPNYPAAMCALFGLIYNLHLDYPKGMKLTFEFIQKVIMQIGVPKLPPKLQSLKNLLLAP